MFAYLYVLAYRFRNDRRAVTAMEYGLIAALVAVAIIGALGTLGTKLGDMFNGIANTMSAHTPS